MSSSSISMTQAGWTLAALADKVETPYIDQLAGEGMRVPGYYAPAPNCSPSRAGLLTGRFPFRVGMYSYVPANSVMHLPDSEVTIAEVLKAEGYSTGMFGKWHLSGLQSEQPTPDKQGFDLQCQRGSWADYGSRHRRPERLAELRRIMIDLHRDAIEEGTVWEFPEASLRNRKRKQ